MVSEETYRIHRTIIYCVVLVFEVFGLFGNLNLIVLTIRKKSLQTKYGLILSFLAVLHTFCLIFELVDMSFSIAASVYSYHIHRTTCFFAIIPYIFIHSLQTGTVWVLSLDLLITILFPIRYRTFYLSIYFPCIFSLPFLYGTVTVIFGFIYLKDAELQMCNPPSALPPLVTAKWYYFMMVFTALTVFFYLSAFLLIYFKARRNSNDIRFIEKKALKTLKFLISVFLILRCITISLASILIALGIDKEIIALVQNYNIIVGVMAYSQNAYICYFRSSEYRTLLQEQLSKIHPKLGAILPKNERLSSLDQKQTSVSVVKIKKNEKEGGQRMLRKLMLMPRLSIRH